MYNIYKDIIIQIALKCELKELLELSLSCNKYYECIWNNRLFWRMKIERDFNVIDYNPETYKILYQIKENPQKYYTKSIYEKDDYTKRLIEQAFQVYFPLVGVQNLHNPNYFGICHVEMISKRSHIPHHIPNIWESSDITLKYYTKAMGLNYYDYESLEQKIMKLYSELESYNMIFNVGDKFL